MSESQMTTDLRKLKRYNNDLNNLSSSILNHTIYTDPPEHAVLDYIATTGTQYINTNITPDNTTDIEIIYKNIDSNANPAYERVFGQNSSAGNARYQVEYSGPTNVLVGLNGSTTSVSVDARTSFTTIKLTGTGIFYVNGSQVTNLARSETNSYPIWIGRGYDRYSSMYFKACKIWKGGELVLDLIPCRKDSDNLVCMYDKISKTYFTNAGTGIFDAGEEV